MKEIWKPVRGKEDYAEISNLGQIHRFEREWYSGGNHQIKKVQKETWTYGYENYKGYLYASIGGVHKGVHQWVYMTFNDCDIPKGMDVNHIDENPKNNCVWNLNLMTRKENINWGTHNARVAAAHRGKKLSEEHKEKIGVALRGKKHSPEHIAKVAAAESKPVQALKKITGEVIYDFPSINEAGRQGFDASTVSKCCRGEHKTHKGYIWRYKE